MVLECELDEIGPWTEVKLEIVKEYASAYSRILAAQTNPSFEHVYIDAFAGPGIHISRTDGRFVPGSPLNALNVEPPFKEYYFIDIDHLKIQELEKLADENPHQIFVYPGDCNQILLEKVFPQVKYGDYRRGLCLLDPYSMQLNWEVIEHAGQMGSMEIFLNFPIGPINRSVLVSQDPGKINEARRNEMDRVWGDSSWRELLYKKKEDLFGYREEKVTNEKVKEAFQKRLKEKAGFKYVPEPIPMKNTKGAIVFYLFFAAHKPVAKKIVEGIFRKYTK